MPEHWGVAFFSFPKDKELKTVLSTRLHGQKLIPIGVKKRKMRHA